jgi:hypothetical protein
MAIQINNNAASTLGVSILAADLSLTVSTGTGGRYPTLGVGDYFYGVLEDVAHNIEIVKVTARAGDVMTIERAQEGTTALNFAAGSLFELRLTAQTFYDMIVAGLSEYPDTVFRVYDDGDSTKRLAFSVGGITTGTTRTVTFPDADFTAVGLALAQTLTNKTIDLGSNAITMTKAQLNAAVTDDNPAYVGTVNTWTATQVPDSGTAAVSTTSTYNFDGADQIREITLTNAIVVTFGAPTGITQNAMYKLILKAGDTSARSFSWNSAYKFPSATPPLTSGTTTNGAFDVISFIGGASNTLLYQGHVADVR